MNGGAVFDDQPVTSRDTAFLGCAGECGSKRNTLLTVFGQDRDHGPVDANNEAGDATDRGAGERRFERAVPA